MDDRPDLRLPALGATAWLAALLGPHEVALAVVLAAGAATLLVGRKARWRATLAGALVVLAAVGAGAAVRADAIRLGPVAELASEEAGVSVTAEVTSDPQTITGRYGEQALLHLRVTSVVGRGVVRHLRTSVLLLGDPSWAGVQLGATVAADGRLEPATSGDVAGLLVARSDPRMLDPPGPWWRAAGAVRSSLRRSAGGLPGDQRALVPALVDGDDAALDPRLADDFRATGLTHLLAVSGTNLTLVVGFLLLVARWSGVRGRWLLVVGAAGIGGFVLLARAEPSVLRAAVMGSVALVSLGSNGRERGSRALGLAVVVLMLLDPGLASSPGFALSALATAGILFLAPGWRDALATWLPRWAAEAVAVPAAAQVACTPLVAVISGQVSLVAVAANLVVAPAVGPATVLGLAGGLTGLVWSPLGRLFGGLAGWCVAWIVWVARHGARLPGAAIGWGSGPVAVVLLVALTVAVALAARPVLRRPMTGVACSALLVMTLLVRLPTPGWPPAGWVMVACDVGQGDGLVLNAGHHQAVVVDAGPDPPLIDACLRRLDVSAVPLVVLTHFHADHVDGLSGVLHGRDAGRIEVTRLADPPQGVRLVRQAAAASGRRPEVAPYDVTRRVGQVTLQTLWPLPGSPTVGPGDGSTANNASVVMLAEVSGVRIFLGGDLQPEGQAQLARMLPGLRVDVLKVPHHGSRYQDLGFLCSLGARLAVISVGLHNDYGHPAAETVAALAATGARVLRTDLDGDVAVVVEGGRLTARTRP